MCVLVYISPTVSLQVLPSRRSSRKAFGKLHLTSIPSWPGTINGSGELPREPAGLDLALILCFMAKNYRAQMEGQSQHVLYDGLVEAPIVVWVIFDIVTVQYSNNTCCSRKYFKENCCMAPNRHSASCPSNTLFLCCTFYRAELLLRVKEINLHH